MQCPIKSTRKQPNKCLEINKRKETFNKFAFFFEKVAPLEEGV